jgi:hypothetical protein
MRLVADRAKIYAEDFQQPYTFKEEIGHGAYARVCT